jgi:IclR family mhp operon transcriptional activator
MKSRVQSALRCLDVLVALNARNGATLAEIVAATGLTRGTAYRLLETLVDAGYVSPDRKSRTYTLEPKVRLLSDGYADERWVRDVGPYLSALGERLKWPVKIVTLRGTHVLVRATTDQDSRLVDDITPAGRRIPITQPAAGHVFLAFMGAEERRAILDEVGVSRIPPGLMASLPAIRRLGYRLIRGNDRYGALAVPIVARGKVFATLTLQFYKRSLTDSQLRRDFAPVLKAAAIDIAKLIGPVPR